tara:strand:- start:12692 stop:13177 length:486 start_codon:yes stop_codon:yes gene_type:complete
MTFIKNKFFKSISKTDATGQEISNTYIEIQGSRIAIEKLNTSSDLYYFFSFSSSVRASAPYEKTFLHVKLQKSNDDFSSNIVDVAGCNYNFSTDTGGSTDHLNKGNNVFFIVQNTNNDTLRLIARSWSSSNRSVVNQTYHFDGSTPHSNKFYYPTLTVKEL